MHAIINEYITDITACVSPIQSLLLPLIHIILTKRDNSGMLQCGLCVWAILSTFHELTYEILGIRPLLIDVMKICVRSGIDCIELLDNVHSGTQSHIYTVYLLLCCLAAEAQRIRRIHRICRINVGSIVCVARIPTRRDDSIPKVENMNSHVMAARLY
jgi:hypothetical protein